jgi:kanamycin kinase
MSDRAAVRGEKGSPTPPEFIPRRVVNRFAGANWIPLSYEHPSRCWRIETTGSPSTSVYLKVSAVGVAAGVADERQRLLWAAGKFPVPSLIDAGDDEGMQWMLLGALRGTDGTDQHRLGRPDRLVRMLANALRQLHDVPATCPFDFRLPMAMAHVETRLRRGQIDPTEFKLEYAHFTPEAAVGALRRDLPSVEDPVITHGDYCVPNVIFDGDCLSGFVDVAALGVADRWRDLAVATWSIEWNIGPGWEDLFLSTYGAERDPARMRFFRLLYELAS